MDTALAATATQTLVPEPRTLAEKFAALPLKPVVLLAVGAAALAAVAITLALQSGSSDYRVLYSGLSDKDGGAVISQLSQMNVPYRHADGGGAIMVPSAQVLDLRMRLSNMGLPRNSVVGYELLDTQKFGQTQAGEGMSMKRATEGELMRTIGSLSAVQQVRVHLALPQQNGFFREQQKPSASVMLTLHPGRTLERTQLAGIVHLVASSVPELSAKAVSVVDGDGNLLTGPESGAQGLDAQQLRYVQQVESSLQRRVVELLEPVMGRENLRATITAEVDFSESMLVSEEFKPNQGDAPAAVKTLQTVESTQPGLTLPAGIPGAQTNQPPAPATAPIEGNVQALQGAQAGAGGTSRRESTANYEIDRVQRTTRNATGTIKRLSAAVVVNHRQGTDARGRQVSSALNADELEKLTALVQQGIGYNAGRGDSVRVINAPFRVDSTPEAEEVPLWQQGWLIDMLRAAAIPGALAFVALLIVMTTIRPALKSLLAPPAPTPLPGANLDTVVDDTALLTDESQRSVLEPLQHAQRLEDARVLARENPVAMANIIRSMINGEQASA